VDSCSPILEHPRLPPRCSSPPDPDVVYVAGNAGLPPANRRRATWTNLRSDHVSTVMGTLSYKPNRLSRVVCVWIRACTVARTAARPLDLLSAVSRPARLRTCQTRPGHNFRTGRTSSSRRRGDGERLVGDVYRSTKRRRQLVGARSASSVSSRVRRDRRRSNTTAGSRCRIASLAGSDERHHVRPGASAAAPDHHSIGPEPRGFERLSYTGDGRRRLPVDGLGTTGR